MEPVALSEAIANLSPDWHEQRRPLDRDIYIHVGHDGCVSSYGRNQPAATHAPLCLAGPRHASRNRRPA